MEKIDLHQDFGDLPPLLGQMGGVLVVSFIFELHLIVVVDVVTDLKFPVDIDPCSEIRHIDRDILIEVNESLGFPFEYLV